jgi:sortase A
MRNEPVRKLLSYVLIAGGAFLLFLGARDVWESRFGQREAAREFESATAAPELESSPEASLETPTAGDAAPRPVSTRTGDAIGKLIIPRLDAELYVMEGDGPKELRRGPGHLIGTAMPGAKGNCVIAGHRDTHFRVLKDIQKGDDIVLQTKQGKFLYRVRELKIVSPNNTEPIQPTSDAQLNLITCYPFYYVGSAPKRFVVEARLAGMVPRTS